MLKTVKLKNGNVVLRGTTPKGRFEYAKVFEPQTKIGDQAIEPTYSATLIMNDSEEVQEFINQLQGELEKATGLAEEAASKVKGRKAKMPICHDENFGQVYDDDGNPTGEFYIKAKAKAEGETQAGKRWKFKPTVFDAKGKPFPEQDPPLVGNGSTGRLAITAYAYAAPIGYGVSIRLDAAQVLNLVEYNGRSASDYGFAVEEGYSIDDAAPLGDADPNLSDVEEQPKSYRSRLSEPDDETGDF